VATDVIPEVAIDVIPEVAVEDLLKEEGISI